MNDLIRIDCKANFVNLKSLIMKTNFSLLFYMKKQKNYLSGDAPIYLRITVALGLILKNNQF